MHGGYGGLYCDGGPDVTLSVLLGIFFASLRAVLCVAVLAAAGLWLSRAGVLTPRLSKGLSSLSVKLAIPALLFSSIVSSDAGISVELLSATWPLLLLPALYLVLGALVGCITLWLVDPPRTFRLGTVAACCFGNTTGIPIVLLSVLQQSLSRAVFVELADPLMFLAIELLSVPLLQYVAGSLLLRHAGVGSEGELRTAEAAAQPPRAFSPGAEEMLSKMLHDVRRRGRAVHAEHRQLKFGESFQPLHFTPFGATRWKLMSDRRGGETLSASSSARRSLSCMRTLRTG